MGERCVGRFHTPTHCCLCYIISLDDARAPGFDKACVHDDDGEKYTVPVRRAMAVLVRKMSSSDA
ncbi:hypothetical protein L916_14742 [Phytophthora nicotianae]|uniref:Uncharacterized protein n=1 Tax=Phytophthora nicotianae TaxID=4792 RepID=W2IEX1_PHYNI|nr:hypothetical protein L916_14742 [Phytophthora nicotianae]